MKETIQLTYSQVVQDERLLELSRKSAEVYNLALHTFWDYVAQHNKWLSKFDLQKEMRGKYERTILHSDSYLSALQKFYSAVSSAKKAIKEYKKNPDRFTGEPKYPTKEKCIYCNSFKQSAIRIKNGNLFLSLAKGNDPIKLRWDKSLGTPVYVTIAWNPNKGWIGHFVIEKLIEHVETLDIDKIMGIDLGVKRLATTFDGENCVTYTGKSIMSLIRLREKTNGKIKSKQSGLKKHSRKYKRFSRAKRRINKRINDKIKDVTHKTSRTIVNYAIQHNIGKIVIGDNSSTHDMSDQESNPFNKKEKSNRQMISQGVEQKLRNQIIYKLESIGGIAETIPEHYTSKTCPKCSTRKTKDQSRKMRRTYTCNNKKCKFIYDRDGVGSINIWGLAHHVSLGKAFSLIEKGFLNVVGGLTPPIGWKYHSSQNCLWKACLS